MITFSNKSDSIYVSFCIVQNLQHQTIVQSNPQPVEITTVFCEIETMGDYLAAKHLLDSRIDLLEFMKNFPTVVFTEESFTNALKFATYAFEDANKEELKNFKEFKKVVKDVIDNLNLSKIIPQQNNITKSFDDIEKEYINTPKPFYKLNVDIPDKYFHNI